MPKRLRTLCARLAQERLRAAVVEESLRLRTEVHRRWSKGESAPALGEWLLAEIDGLAGQGRSGPRAGRRDGRAAAAGASAGQ